MKKRSKFTSGMVIFLAIMTTLAFSPFIFGRPSPPPADQQPSYNFEPEEVIATSTTSVEIIATSTVEEVKD